MITIELFIKLKMIPPLNDRELYQPKLSWQNTIDPASLTAGNTSQNSNLNPDADPDASPDPGSRSRCRSRFQANIQIQIQVQIQIHVRDPDPPRLGL